MKIFTSPFIFLVRIYQKFISPFTAARCRYAPSCSSYTVESLQVHGIFKGLLLSIWRLLRCNPLSKGGVDRVPEKGNWPKKPLGYTELMSERAAQSRRIHKDNVGGGAVTQL